MRPLGVMLVSRAAAPARLRLVPAAAAWAVPWVAGPGSSWAAGAPSLLSRLGLRLLTTAGNLLQRAKPRRGPRSLADPNTVLLCVSLKHAASCERTFLSGIWLPPFFPGVGARGCAS